LSSGQITVIFASFQMINPSNNPYEKDSLSTLLFHLLSFVNSCEVSSDPELLELKNEEISFILFKTHLM
tara:strand:- start:2280 stop:2486 length:207 start_codon:yes stop_codon:yes gene_type:complete